MTILNGLLAWGLWLVLMMGVLSVGDFIIRKGLRLSISDVAPLRYSMSIGIGLIGLSTLIMYASLVGILREELFWALLAILSLFGIHRGARLIRDIYQADHWHSEFPPGLILMAGIALMALPLLVLPPTARDGLVYHLEVPRQQLLHGGMVANSNIYGYFPMGVEMLYLFSLAVFPPYAVQFAHFGFLLLTLLVIVESGPASSPRSAIHLMLPGLLVLATVPTFWLDATWAYIDLGWAFFTILMVAGIYHYLRTRNTGPLICGAIIMGFYPAIKYPGFYYLLALLLAFLLIVLKDRMRLQDLRRAIPAMVVAGLVTASPYFIRNLILTGNPVFPFMTTVIPTNSPFWSPAHEIALVDGLLHQYGAPFLHPLLRIANYFIAALNSTLEQPELFDGVLGPFLLLWIPVWWMYRPKSPHARFSLSLIIISGLIWSYSLRQARFLLPILPVILLFTIGSIQEGARRRWKELVWGVVCAGIVLFNLAVLVPAVWSRMPPAAGLIGKMDREAYLERRLPVYSCQHFINRSLPPQAVVWVLLTGNENFYLQRDYQADYVIEDFTFQQWLSQSRNPGDLAVRFRGRGITHLLVRTDLLYNPLLYLDKPDKFPLAVRFFQSNRLLYHANGFAVYTLGK
jgi:hypothetical protein